MKKGEKITIHHIFWYFIFFSVIGLLIETLYCYITMGKLESRKGLLWGPLCPVYGVGASLLIIFLNKYRDKKILTLFIYGVILGSVVEYILSYCLESIYGMRFWDYGYLKLNLNGRISLQYSGYWGIMSVILVKYIKPLIDQLMEKLNIKFRNTIEICLFMFLIINCIMTIWGIQTYENRVLYNKENRENPNNIVVKIKQDIENDYFTNERMSRIFPNIRIKDKEGNEIWIKSLIDEDSSHDKSN